MTDRVVPVAAAVITRPDGKVLLAQRPPGKAFAGYWEFPGGKLEPGESPRDALTRELAEELGITEQQVANFKFDFLARLRTLVKNQRLNEDVFPELQEEAV